VGGAARALRGARGLSFSFGLVRALPRRLVSRTLGAAAGMRVPGFVLRPALSLYCRHFDVDLSESERPLSDYATFNDFFTRALKPGARPLDADPAALLSPVDGRVHASGPIEQGAILQAKGVPYRLEDLLGSADDARLFDGGTFATLYLSPRDYHRIHHPADGELLRVRPLPGDLWPVNDEAVSRVPRLFARNERVACVGRFASGAPYAMVPVGALNVGSIRLTFVPLRTNRSILSRDVVAFDPPLSVRRGEEFGRFEFGSAVVLLLSKAAGEVFPLESRSPVRLGRPIGRLRG
jgi:phosphatidylserine decarboxylase